MSCFRGKRTISFFISICLLNSDVPCPFYNCILGLSCPFGVDDLSSMTVQEARGLPSFNHTLMLCPCTLHEPSIVQTVTGAVILRQRHQTQSDHERCLRRF